MTNRIFLPTMPSSQRINCRVSTTATSRARGRTDAAVDWFPKDVIDKYGGEIQLTPNGYHLYLPGENADRIAAELRARGHSVEESNDDLPAFISYTYGDESMDECQ